MILALAQRVRPGRADAWVSFPIVCSAVLFWLGHLPYAAFNVGAAVAERGCTRGSGYVYGLLCQRSRSVWPAIGAHCAGNLIALVASAA